MNPNKYLNEKLGSLSPYWRSKAIISIYVISSILSVVLLILLCYGVGYGYVTHNNKELILCKKISVHRAICGRRSRDS